RARRCSDILSRVADTVVRISPGILSHTLPVALVRQGSPWRIERRSPNETHANKRSHDTDALGRRVRASARSSRHRQGLTRRSWQSESWGYCYQMEVRLHL